MERITSHFERGLNWIETTTNECEGEKTNNFVEVSPQIHTGTRYFFECCEGISALYLDVEYMTDLHIIQKSKIKNSVGIYYDLSDRGEVRFSSQKQSEIMGRWGYDLSVVDSESELEYFIKEGTRTFALCLFVQKDLLYSLKRQDQRIENFFGPKDKTRAKLGRMSYESFRHLEDLRQGEVGSIGFDLNLTATAYILISELLDSMLVEESASSEISDIDLLKIVDSEKILNENLKGTFPGIAALSGRVNMSPSKFKNVFKKVLKTSPQSYHMNSKLYNAKELLEQKQLSITQVSEQFGFCNVAHFGSAFKKRYDMSPKIFAQLLS